MEVKKQRYDVDVEQGVTWRKETNIISWPCLIAVDLITLPGTPPAAAIMTGGLTPQQPTQHKNKDRRTRMVSLSDGTQFVFARLGQLTVVQGNDALAIGLDE